ncbi:hypothetical protein [Coralloluteibacterium thermophilus]|uniref:Lipoprotein n=1 Tax=Coralloluteibacterium thermophilum TaxID=2707049 RepID=A0ABV9NGS3_9GAMM
MRATIAMATAAVLAGCTTAPALRQQPVAMQLETTAAPRAYARCVERAWDALPGASADLSREGGGAYSVVLRQHGQDSVLLLAEPAGEGTRVALRYRPVTAGGHGAATRAADDCRANPSGLSVGRDG